MTAVGTVNDQHGTKARHAATTVSDQRGTGPDAVGADEKISRWRSRIDDIDASIIELWRERAAISQQVGAARVAAGGTRLVLSREREILDRFGAALGEDGTQLALLLLRAGRGRL